MAGKKQPKLTEGQKACLRLVDQLLTSKEIGRKLNISHFTVDQRLDVAREKLGAKDRKEAARIFAAMEAGELSERLVYEPSDVDMAENPAKLAGSNNSYGDYSRNTNHQAGRWVLFDRVDSEGNLIQLTMPKLGGGDHDLSRIEVAVAIIKTALFSIIGVSAITIIIVGLMRVLG